MERCPNCGAPVRPGARFCTTCGYRVADEQAPDPASAAPAAQAAENDQPAAGWASAWPMNAPASSDEGAASQGSTDTDSSMARADEQDANPDGASAGGGPDSVETTGAPSAAEEAGSSFPSWSSGGAAWGSGWGTAREDTGQTAAAREWPQPAPATEAPAADTASADVTEATTHEPAGENGDGAVVVVAEETVANVEPAPATTNSGDDFGAGTDGEGTAPAAATSSAVAEPTPSGGLDRANALIDELRDLLPTLAGPGQPEVDPSAIAANLSAARAAADDPAFDGLRGALDNAREHPRDVETMLEIMRRLDAISALQGAYDGLVAAIDQAMTDLRGDGSQ